MKDGLGSWCKACKNKASYEAQKLDPEKLKTKSREAGRRYRAKPQFKSMERVRQLRYHYGISADEVARMMKEQGGKCKICLSTPSDTLVVDHCHESLIVRGLLCRKCNAAIGFMNDDIKLVRRAVAYLEETQNAG